jgi:hypothetical protein
MDVVRSISIDEGKDDHVMARIGWTRGLVGAILVGLLSVPVAIPASAAEKPSAYVYVDCAAAPGGDGGKKTPLPSVTDAVTIGRALSAERSVTISVAPGICDDEVLPIVLDFPVVVRGSRTPDVDGEGLPLNGQDHDTLVTWVPPTPVPPSVATLAFFRITGPGVRISKLSLDGMILPGTVTPAPPAPAPIGVLAHNARDFVVDQLRIVRMGNAVRAQGSSGRIRDTYTGTVGAGIVLTGGDPGSPPKVICENNRIEDYWLGAFAVSGAGPAGRSVRAVVQGNDTSTRYTDTGPSNPFAVRIGPLLPSPSLQGTVEAVLSGNRFRGAPRYAIIVNAGTAVVRRADGLRYSGSVDATFADNLIDETGVTRAVALITFTNSRATELPCELDPANTKDECPSLTGSPLQYWEYLEASVFDVHHSGELDGALVDHPEVEPVDGRVLGNLLLINDAVVSHQTFVILP